MTSTPKEAPPMLTAKMAKSILANDKICGGDFSCVNAANAYESLRALATGQSQTIATEELEGLRRDVERYRWAHSAIVEALSAASLPRGK